MKFLLVLTFLCWLISLQALAGKEGGGGLGVICHDRVYLADTYSILSNPKLQALKSADPAQVLSAITQVIEEKYPQKIFTNPNGGEEKVSLAWMLSHTRGAIEFDYTNKPLPLLNDDHFDTSTLQPGCIKQQIAIQDIPKHRVLTDQVLVSKMSFLERGLFELHESMISFRNQPGESTAPIRQMVGNLVQEDLPLFTTIINRIQAQSYTFTPEIPAWFTAKKQLYDCSSDSGGESLKFMYDISDHDFRSMPRDFKRVFYCNYLRQKEGDSYTQQDRNTAFRTLLEVPKHLGCYVTSQGMNALRWPVTIGSKFSVDRLNGGGRPNNIFQSQNLLRFEDAALGTSKYNSNAVFVPHRHDHDYLFPGELGSMYSSITWATESGNAELTLFLDHYNEMTKEFVGKIQKTPASVSVTTKTPYSSFGVICLADGASFGVDMDETY